MPHWTKCNFSTADIFFDKISEFKGEIFSSLENWRSLDGFKYLNILCYFCIICRSTLWQVLFLSKLVTEKFLLHETQVIMTVIHSGKPKVNAKRWTLSPRLIKECKSLLLSGFISQQNGAPAHMVMLAQDWVATNCSEFIGKDEWPPNWTDVNPLDCHAWGVMLGH